MPLFSVSYILLPKHLIRIDLPIDLLLLFYYPSIFPCGCYLTLNLYKSLAERHGDALAGIARQHLIQYRTLGGAGAVDGYVCMNTQLLVTEESACCLHRRFMNLPGSLDMLVSMSVIFGAFA